MCIVSKMKTCPVCGKEMAANAKTCPSCGAKNKKPFYKKWWFWVLLVVVIGAAGSAASGGNSGAQPSEPKQPSQQTAAPPEGETSQPEKPEESEAPEEPEITYTAYTVRQLMDDLDSNALRAKNTYLDQYVELSGSLNVIDNDGKYISIVPADDNFAIIGVQCAIQTDGQLNRVLEMNIGDNITVRGKITDVGEVLGYSLDIDDFVA